MLHVFCMAEELSYQRKGRLPPQRTRLPRMSHLLLYIEYGYRSDTGKPQTLPATCPEGNREPAQGLMVKQTPHREVALKTALDPGGSSIKPVQSFSHYSVSNYTVGHTQRKIYFSPYKLSSLEG